MRLAVCMPQVPFERGGTEIFADGLVQALREHGHETELVTVPFKWYPGERVLTQAFLWRLLDLEEANGRPIDAVIATKFPSYVDPASEQGRLAAAPVPAGVGSRPHRARPVLRVGRGPRAAAQGARARPGDARRGEEDLHDVVDRRRAPARLDRARGRGARAAARAARISTATAYEDFILSVNRLDRAKRIDLLIEAAAQAPGAARRDRRRRSRPRAPRAARARARARRSRDVHGPRLRRGACRSLRALPRRVLRAGERGLRARAVRGVSLAEAGRHDDGCRRPARHRARARDRARRRAARSRSSRARASGCASTRTRRRPRACRARDVARAVTWDACVERLLEAVADEGRVLLAAAAEHERHRRLLRAPASRARATRRGRGRAAGPHAPRRGRRRRAVPHRQRSRRARVDRRRAPPAAGRRRAARLRDPSPRRGHDDRSQGRPRISRRDGARGGRRRAACSAGACSRAACRRSGRSGPRSSRSPARSSTARRA